MGAVKNQAAAKQPGFNDDGTPRRKYELDALADGKAIRRITIGFVLANAFLLLKNILFDAGKTEAQAARAPRPDAAEGGISDEVALAEETEVGPEDPKEAEAGETPAPRTGSGTLFGRHGTGPFEDLAERIAPMRFSPPTQPDNDNVPLYGLTPGHVIDVFSARGDQMPAVVGGGSSGGGWPDGDEDDTPSGPDPDSDIDDGDPTTPPPPANRLPLVLAPVVLASLLADEARTLAATDLLQHASDPDGDSLTVRQLQASSGRLEPRESGGWTFTPDPDDTGSVTFTYLISDGHGTSAQTASLDLLPRPAAPGGTLADDTLVGTAGRDVLDGFAGDDIIIGGDGDDVLFGGSGNDRIVAGDGNDVVHGGSGNDVVFTGAGNDAVFLGSGDDVALGEGGNDALLGEAGDDVLSGGEGDDTLAGGSGDDRLDGGDGKDVIEGGTGQDNIDAGAGDDAVLAGSGNDTVSLGEGDDTAIAEADDGDDWYDGGEGIDSYDLSSTSANALIDLFEDKATSLEIGDDMIFDFENIHAGRGNDTIIASDSTNVMIGGGGDDVFVFRSSASIGMGAGHRDRILDFDVGDRIDLEDVREEFADELDQTFEDLHIRRFKLIQSQEDFTEPGEMKLRYEELNGNAVTILQGNTDFDAEAEFELELAGHYQLSETDFHRTS